MIPFLLVGLALLALMEDDEKEVDGNARTVPTSEPTPKPPADNVSSDEPVKPSGESES